MNITSLGFLCFLALAIGLYYLFAEKAKPWVLLGLSFLFAASYDMRAVLFLAATAWFLWVSALAIQKISDSQQESSKQKKKRLLVLTLAGIAGVLVVLKYLAPLTLRAASPALALRIFVPIGLSSYTLMAISYLVDVYWGRVRAEGRYSRVLLYLTYFPQLLQGPISRFGQLAPEFDKPHPFRVRNIKHGIQLILWGYFKLSVVGGKTHTIVTEAFHSGATAYGLAAFLGLVFFGFELYGNFSGGIDVIRGVSQCLGIELPENFRQPFFSRSLGEFWRRWHITLGTWMKDYVFFPLSMSKPFSRLKKNLRKRVSKKMATRIPIALANILVFLLVGIWHGLGGNYALWGLYNGLILAFSEIMADRYLRTKQALHISPDSKAWNAFSLLRTFLVITLGWATDCAATASGSFAIVLNMLQVEKTDFGIFHATKLAFLEAAFSIVILLAVDFCHERGISIRKSLDGKNIFIQCLFWIALIQLIACLGRTATLGGLMYAGF